MNFERTIEPLMTVFFKDTTDWIVKVAETMTSLHLRLGVWSGYNGNRTTTSMTNEIAR